MLVLSFSKQFYLLYHLSLLTICTLILCELTLYITENDYNVMTMKQKTNKIIYKQVDIAKKKKTQEPEFTTTKYENKADYVSIDLINGKMRSSAMSENNDLIKSRAKNTSPIDYRIAEERNTKSEIDEPTIDKDYITPPDKGKLNSKKALQKVPQPGQQANNAHNSHKNLHKQKHPGAVSLEYFIPSKPSDVKSETYEPHANIKFPYQLNIRASHQMNESVPLKLNTFKIPGEERKVSIQVV